jgi:eukaryotic-like serine/threonine-protein kinase
MPLTPGARLDPYEIVAPLGRGGMGEVFRARDTKLQRDVALKVLPDLFANDPERLARFTREAQTLAALNHPNIAHIHGLEESNGVSALVMELVDGEDLSAIVARGPLALVDALPIARQLADALEAAHDQGIVHRDLKPANVKVRPDGTVKVLDFGLAKALAPEGAGAAADQANSPTLTAAAFAPGFGGPGTQLGMILGTAAYMAPEQARGKSVDKRADIWAFGVVLYEMLAGTRTFKGEEVSDVLAAVLRQEIDWTALPAGTPLRLRRLLERCLDRDAKTRLRDIGEARVELARMESGAPDTIAGAVASRDTPRSRVRGAIAFGVAGVALLVAGALVGRYVQPAAGASNAAVVRLAFVPPEGLTFEAGRLDTVVVSPDGRQLAFSARSADGKRQLYVRALDGVEARLLPGTEEPIKPFWSPDSKSIAFGAQGKLKRIDIGGLRPAIVADAPRLNGGAWNRAGVIVFSPDYNAGLFQVSEKGGTTRAVTMPDAARQETALSDPAFLPDGVRFLYTAGAKIRLGSLSAPTTTFVTDGSSPRVVAPDRVLFHRGWTLFAGTLDPARAILAGEPVRVFESVEEDQNSNRGDIPFSASDTGVLVQKNGFAPDYQLVWFDRQGRSLGTIGMPIRLAGEPFAPRISPDGTRVAIQNRLSTADRSGLWVIDLQRDLPTRLFPRPGQYPQWSADGRRVAWVLSVDGVIGIYQKPATGLGDPELLLKSGPEAGGTTFPNDWSRDGRFILYHSRGEKTRIDVWALPLFGDRKPHPVLNTEFDDGPAQVSPDGRWLAYRSDASGTYEIYVQSFTADGRAGSGRVRISTNGGGQPRFRPDGQELFYLSGDGRLMAVPITGHGATFEHGEPKVLFKTRTLPPIVEVQFEYDVTRDGQRFLMGTILDGPNAMPPAPTIVLNWMAEARK